MLAAPVVGQDRWPTAHSDTEAYDRFMGRWSRLVAPALVDFAAVPDSGRVLDIGTGTGSLAFEIARKRPRVHVVGIDPSPGVINESRSRNPFPDRASFQAADAQRLPFRDATFQSSVSQFVFNFIPDPGKALREARRVTQPGKRISAAVWDYGAGMRMLRVFWDAAVSTDPGAEKVDEKHMPLCRSGELSRLWKEGGLEDIDEQPLDITMQFRSFADYWEPFLLGQGPAGAYARRIGSDKLRALRAEVKRRLSLSAEDVPFALPARAWAARGSVPADR
jgi:SAM-dependent methyltransferase